MKISFQIMYRKISSSIENEEVFIPSNKQTSKVIPLQRLAVFEKKVWSTLSYGLIPWGPSTCLLPKKIYRIYFKNQTSSLSEDVQSCIYKEI